MADFELTRVDRYPNGTSVSAYPESNWPAGVVETDAAPLGAASDTQTMTNSTLTFTGLTKGERYVARAEIGGQDRYLAFTAGEDVAEGSDQANPSENETITGSWTFSEPVAVGTPTAAGQATTKGALDTHEADTTSVHGIADTSLIPLKNADNEFTAPQSVGSVLRSTGTASPPVSGSGVELLFAGGEGYVLGFNRGTGTYLPLRLEGTEVSLETSTTKRVRVNATGIGFFGVAPVARPAAYVQTYATADRTLGAYTADVESAAYTGIDNLQAGDVYAQITGLNNLRVAYENLRLFVEDLAQHHNSVVDDLQANGLFQ